MTDYRPTSATEWPEDTTRYPATVTDPDALSDDVSASSYVLFRGMDENGKRSAARADFAGIPANTVEVRLLVEPQVLGTQLQVFGASLDDAVLFNVNPLWGSGAPSPTPPVAALTWVTTGEVTVTGSLASGFYVGLVNQSPTTGLSADIYLYEMVLVATGSPIMRVYPRSDGRGLSSARRVWPPSKASQDNRWLPYGGGYR